MASRLKAAKLLYGSVLLAYVHNVISFQTTLHSHFSIGNRRCVSPMRECFDALRTAPRNHFVQSGFEKFYNRKYPKTQTCMSASGRLNDKVLIVGAGVAGMSCANVLSEKGIPFQILEASDGIGGRIRTDKVDGFLLDRGFQIFLTSYPEAQRLFDYKCAFYSCCLLVAVKKKINTSALVSICS